jgi:hypothetical protein
MAADIMMLTKTVPEQKLLKCRGRNGTCLAQSFSKIEAVGLKIVHK